MEQLEAWMSVRDPQVKDKNFGDSITLVEELLRRQQDFEKTVDAQEEKFTAIKRATQVTKVLYKNYKKLVPPIFNPVLHNHSFKRS